jgi:hypothetical protein
MLTWKKLEFANMIGITLVQWDGGPMYSIHGESIRMLPALNLERLFQISEEEPPSLAFELLAEGYRREVTVPVIFNVEGESGTQAPTNPLPGWI